MEDIQIAAFACEDTENANRAEMAERPPSGEVKVEFPTADPKSIYLQGARLRNRSARIVGTKPPGRNTKPTEAAAAAVQMLELLSAIDRVLKDNDSSEARSLFETLKGHMHLARTFQREAQVLETFDGVLDCIDGDTAYLTLTSTANGDVLYAEYPAAKFAEKGIEEEDRFICKTVDTDGGTHIEIEAVPDVELTEEHLKAIREKIYKVLPRNDPGVKY